MVSLAASATRMHGLSSAILKMVFVEIMQELYF
jgi:hypothetical protein